jgi:hypothetical protein
LGQGAVCGGGQESAEKRSVAALETAVAGENGPVESRAVASTSSASLGLMGEKRKFGGVRCRECPHVVVEEFEFLLQRPRDIETGLEQAQAVIIGGDRGQEASIEEDAVLGSVLSFSQSTVQILFVSAPAYPRTREPAVNGKQTVVSGVDRSACPAESGEKVLVGSDLVIESPPAGKIDERATGIRAPLRQLSPEFLFEREHRFRFGLYLLN